MQWGDNSCVAANRVGELPTLSDGVKSSPLSPAADVRRTSAPATENAFLRLRRAQKNLELRTVQRILDEIRIPQNSSAQSKTEQNSLEHQLREFPYTLGWLFVRQRQKTSKMSRLTYR